jgi:hypothetical protein
MINRTTPEKVASSISKLSPTEMAYLAGIMDGEGCIMAYQSTHPDNLRVKLQVSIGNTDLNLHEWFKTHLSFGSVSWAYPKGRKPMWKFVVSGLSGIEFLRHLRPHLIIKASQADLVLQSTAFQTIHTGIPQDIDNARQVILEQLRVMKWGA